MIKPTNEPMELIYDSNVQSIIGRVDTPIGPKMYNICARCTTRHRGYSCHRYSHCVAAKDRPGAPWSLPWTHWVHKDITRSTSPTKNYDSVTHYLKGEYM